MPAEIACRRVAVEAILPLRHRILRAGLPSEAAHFDGDADASTRHYAACRNGQPVSCLSLVACDWDGRPAWQLRGMATDEAVQRRGLGRMLLRLAVTEARRDEPDRIFWCNARTSAVGFYERHGWRVVSEVFDIPTAGPHVKMLFEPAAVSRPPVFGFVASQLAFLAAVHVLGGPPWVALGTIACIAQVIADFRLVALAGILPALFWPVTHHFSGDRELFFPYAMHLAAHVVGQFGGRGRLPAATAGVVVVTAFLAIRRLERAGPRVLAVEAAVAAVILAAVVAVRPVAARRPWMATLVAALAAAAAYVGLAF